jgi:hypothetical protein
MRLVDADALCKNINGGIKMALEWESEAHENKDTIGVKYAIATRQSLLAMLERVQLQPTIDAQPVKYGKWKRNASGELNCSYCGYAPKWDDDKFCAGCGAKMDGESDV